MSDKTLDTILIKPKQDGAIVRHPETMRPLKAEGEKVVNSIHWQRYLAAGDVVEVDQKSIKKDAK